MNDPKKTERTRVRLGEFWRNRSTRVRRSWIAFGVCVIGVSVTTSQAGTPSAPSPRTTSIAGALGVPANGQANGSRSTAPSGGLLDPTEAFKPRVRQTNETTLEVTFEIAPRYYLYRDRLGLELVGGAGTPQMSRSAGNDSFGASQRAAGKPKEPGRSANNRKLQFSLPGGKLIDDPTFGRVEVYEKSLTATAVIKTEKGLKGDVQLAVFSQGCAAEGVCFPPQRHEFSIPAWRPADSAQTTTAAWILPSTTESLGFGGRSALRR